tara:strand:- start:1167 stop:1442 length:276 start_codon:yes stop_codon:yes gene_type:complete
MSKLKQIDEYTEETGEDILVLGDRSDRNLYEEAIIGIADRFGMQSSVAYDYDKVIEILARDMSYEEAVEYFDFNIIGAWVGETTPLFIRVL